MLVCSLDKLFASGSHIGELIIWDSVEWTIHADDQIALEDLHYDGPLEIRLASQKQSDMSIQHLVSDGEVFIETNSSL